MFGIPEDVAIWIISIITGSLFYPWRADLFMCGLLGHTGIDCH